MCNLLVYRNANDTPFILLKSVMPTVIHQQADRKPSNRTECSGMISKYNQNMLIDFPLTSGLLS